jgi:hypothetical protein
MIGLGRGCLALGRRKEARECFLEAFALLGARKGWIPGRFRALALYGLERACGDVTALRDEHLAIDETVLAGWHLVPVDVPPDQRPPSLHEAFEPQALAGGVQSNNWRWEDPFSDCSYDLVDGLVVHARPWRTLWLYNRSAPRLLRQIRVANASAFEAVCRPVDARPAIGGLLLWQDDDNWLRLTVNQCGPGDVLFLRCLTNTPAYVGRGTLDTTEEGPKAPPDRVHLRMERIGDAVRAFCSADGEEWFTLGEIDFPFDDGDTQVGLHALGLDLIGTEYIPSPDGTAIRFESFTVWDLSD